MTSTEKTYIAGIIDGEGSIMLIKFHKNQFPSPCVSISSTSIELLEWIKNTTNLGTIKSKKNYNPQKHLDSYIYIVKYNYAIALIEDIYPYLIINVKNPRHQVVGFNGGGEGTPYSIISNGADYILNLNELIIKPLGVLWEP